MTMNEFLSITNEKIEKYNIEFNHNPADGITVIGNKNFKFVQFNYDVKTNQFSFQLNKNLIFNSTQTMKCIQELSLAGEIIEILRSNANNYGTLVLFR